MQILENKFYQKLNRAIELIDKGDFNSLIVLGKAGTGKSFNIDNKLKELNTKNIVFRGDISEAKFYEFLWKHRKGYTIVFRDLGKLLRNRCFIETLKHITEPVKVRNIRREVYKDYDGLPESFDFESRIIIELNEIGKKYKEDIEAVCSRGIFVDLVFSYDEIKEIMRVIPKTDKQKEVTEYLIEGSSVLNLDSFNLRTQHLCFKLRIASERDKLDWKKQIDLFLKTHSSEARKLLYRFSGEKKAKRIDFVKFLIKQKDWSYATCQRRIRSWIELEEIKTDGKGKQDNLFL